MSIALNFNAGDLVVYPAHGVGKLLSIETQQVAGHELQVFVINFEKNRMTLRLPMAKAKAAGLRALSSKVDVERALETLAKRGRVKKGIWSRRAQEYELKINSGNLDSIAEVIRDLHRNSSQPDQSYSERQIYQSALERFTSEISAVKAVDESKALDTIQDALKVA